ncbi:hypothetical protein LG293_16635 (plasmid) [Citricoccus nitrophenolicus]
MNPLDPEAPAAFVQGLSDSLDLIGYQLEAADPDDVALETVLAEAIASNPHRTNGNCAAVALSYHGNDRTEMLVLGDSTALAFRPVEDDGTTPVMLRDSRVSQVAVNERLAVRDAVNRGEGAGVLDCLRRELVTARNEMLNHPNGFWAAADDPTVAVEAVTTTLPRRNMLVLATDGVPGLFGSVPNKLLGAYDGQDLAEILDSMHGRVAERGPVSDMAVAVAAPYTYSGY